MTDPQHMQALRLANDVRLTNAETCRRIAALPQKLGREEVARLLENDESYEFSRMYVEKLVECVRRFGPSMSRVALREIGSSHRGKRVGELTPRQRLALADLMRSGLRSEERAA